MTQVRVSRWLKPITYLTSLLHWIWYWQAASLSNVGVKFYCKNCGREGHRRYYCPELNKESIDRRFRCRVCGEKGHNRRTCKKSTLNSKPISTTCGICGVKGHNRRNCPKSELSNPNSIGMHHLRNGLSLNLINGGKMANPNSRVRQYHCRICNENGHNRRNCPDIDRKGNRTSPRRTFTCKLCHEKGHNSRTCPSRNMNDLQKNPPVALN